MLIYLNGCGDRHTRLQMIDGPKRKGMGNISICHNLQQSDGVSCPCILLPERWI